MTEPHFGEEFSSIKNLEVNPHLSADFLRVVDVKLDPHTTIETYIPPNGSSWYPIEQVEFNINTPNYKYDEAESLKELQVYIDKTYSEHYSNNNIQTMEYLMSIGQEEGFLVGSIIKYAARYGKKDGFNRKDIMKILHYATILLFAHDKNHE
jgi:hypothetical protein